MSNSESNLVIFFYFPLQSLLCADAIWLKVEINLLGYLPCHAYLGIFLETVCYSQLLFNPFISFSAKPKTTVFLCVYVWRGRCINLRFDILIGHTLTVAEKVEIIIIIAVPHEMK